MTSILDALGDPNLFGPLPAFRDLSTWKSWLVFVRAVYGLSMSDAELGVFRAHTGGLRHDVTVTPRRLRS